MPVWSVQAHLPRACQNMELEPDFDSGADAWAAVLVWSATAPGGAVTLEADAAGVVTGPEPPASLFPGPGDDAETFM